MKHSFFKKSFAYLLIAIALVSCFAFLFPQAKSQDSGGNSACFSIMQITDTQYLSWKTPSLYNDVTDWIVANSQAYNLKMVIHTGDLVDTPTHTSEWDAANAAMMTLYNNGIPYCWDAGNHDQLPPNDTANLWLGDSNTDWLGSQYPAFNPAVMRTQPYWVSDIFDGKNTAVGFSCQGFRLLIINLEFLSNSSAINWMQMLIERNPDAKVIVATHDYLNMTGGYGTRSRSNEGVLDYTWGNNFKSILDQYANVFMILSGHIQTRTVGAYNQAVGSREEVFFNRQDLNGQLGAACVRIYNFNLTSMQINVSTYAIDQQSWVTDSSNQFRFAMDPQTPIDNQAAPTPMPSSTPLPAVNEHDGATDQINGTATSQSTEMENDSINKTQETISILSPQNETYTNTVQLNFAINGTVSWAAYNLDYAANITVYGNATLPRLNEGSHNIIIYTNDTAGNNSASEKVYFSIKQETQGLILTPSEAFLAGLAVAFAIVLTSAGLMVYFIKRKNQAKLPIHLFSLQYYRMLYCKLY